MRLKEKIELLKKLEKEEVIDFNFIWNVCEAVNGEPAGTFCHLNIEYIYEDLFGFQVNTAPYYLDEYAIKDLIFELELQIKAAKKIKNT